MIVFEFEKYKICDCGLHIHSYSQLPRIDSYFQSRKIHQAMFALKVTKHFLLILVISMAEGRANNQSLLFTDDYNVNQLPPTLGKDPVQVRSLWLIYESGQPIYFFRTSRGSLRLRITKLKAISFICFTNSIKRSIVAFIIRQSLIFFKWNFLTWTPINYFSHSFYHFWKLDQWFSF